MATEHEFGKHEAKVSNEEKQAVSNWLRGVGIELARCCPPDMGFALLIFDYGEGGNLFYTSSAQRQDMLKAMSEFIQKNTEGS